MSANKQRPPFRAEHLGSLLRPKDLTEKRIKLDDAKALDILNDEELHVIEDRAIRDIVKVQLDLGFHAINDGEYRRHQFWGTFFPNLEGFEEITPEWDMFRLYVPDIAAFSKSFGIFFFRLFLYANSRGRSQARRIDCLHWKDQACWKLLYQRLGVSQGTGTCRSRQRAEDYVGGT